MKHNPMMDAAGYLTSGTQARAEDDDQPSELGQRLLDKWARAEALAAQAREAEKQAVMAAYEATMPERMARFEAAAGKAVTA